MIQIIKIYSTFSSQEKQDFKQYLKQKNQRGDAKNLKLITLIDSGKTKNIDQALYKGESKGAYYALCKRVMDSLIDFVAIKSFGTESVGEFDALKLLLASRIFFQRKLYKIAFKSLIKAESIALKLDNYSILNEIYLTKAEHAYLNKNLALEDILSAIKTNQKQANLELQLNLAYAKIKSELRKEKHPLIQEIVLNTFSELQLEISDALSYKSLYQLMELLTTAATVKSDFYAISPFMADLFDKVEQKGEVVEKHKFYFLNMLYLMGVTDFRNKKFETSKRVTKRLEEELALSANTHQLLFQDRLSELKAINAIYTGNHEVGISLLTSSAKNSLNNSLLLAMCYFQQEQYSRAYAILKDLNRSDKWYLKKAGWTWVVKKNIIEILALMELDKVDTVLHRLERFSRNFNKILHEKGEKRVLTFMRLAKAYYEQPGIVKSEAFKDKVERSFDWLGREVEDIFVMSFFAWLKSKMENKKLYEVTLELVTIPYHV